MRIAGSEWRFWHRVNRRSVLERFVASGCNAAEGDVSWGRLEGDQREGVIMAHPPDTSSNLLFEQWVDSAVEHGHALKVDFKSLRVITPALDILADRAFNADRLILNADVLAGPGGDPPLFSVADMKGMRDRFPEAIISLGSTTASWGGAYRTEHLNMVLSGVAVIGGPVTVCLRLKLLMADVSVLKAFEAADCHVTIWNDFSTFPVTSETAEGLRHLAPHAFLDLCDAVGDPVLMDEAPGIN
jgi:hypothetical protein